MRNERITKDLERVKKYKVYNMMIFPMTKKSRIVMYEREKKGKIEW